MLNPEETMKNNQKGFSAVEVIIIVVIIALVGAVGWLVWDKQKGQDSGEEVTTDAIQQEGRGLTNETDYAESSVNWLRHNYLNNEFSVGIPDGWRLIAISDYGNLYGLTEKDMQYEEGTIAQVEKDQELNENYYSVVFVMSYTADINIHGLYIPPEAKKVESYMTGNNVSVDKYMRQQANDPQSQDDIPKGTIEYQYVLSSGDEVIQILYRIFSGEADRVQIIDQMVETVVFL